MPTESFEKLSKRAKELSTISKTESDDFYEKYILTSKDEVSLVLKSHLYLENTIDKVLSLIIPEPKGVLKMRFFDKVVILESLNFFPSNKIVIDKIKIINGIRNNFSHKLDYKLTTEDIKKLSEKIEVKGKSSTVIFLSAVADIHGYMTAIIDVATLFPFLMSCVRNKHLFREDGNFNMKSIIDSYQNDGVNDIIENMKR